MPPAPNSSGFQELEKSEKSEVARLTFEVGCPYGGDGRRGGLSEAAEGSLLAGGLVGGAVLLFVSVIEHPHGLQGELLSVAEAHTHPALHIRTGFSASPSPKRRTHAQGDGRGKEGFGCIYSRSEGFIREGVLAGAVKSCLKVKSNFGPHWFQFSHLPKSYRLLLWELQVQVMAR